MPERGIAGNILIVDHSAPIRDLLQWVLRRDGYVVTLASDHRTGLCFARDNRFDLVITAHDDGSATSGTFSAKVRAMTGNHDLPILVLSGVEREMLDEAAGGGAMTWMENAGELEQMLEMVASILGGG